MLSAAPGDGRATIDLGEIHHSAVVTDDGHALVASGRGIRTIKRQLSKQLGHIARKRAKKTKGSRRHRRLMETRRKLSRRAKQRIRDLRHKATARAIQFCRDRGVKELWVGNPDGVRKRNCGRQHNQRMARWEYGTDLAYLAYKAKRAGMIFGSGDERGTSSTCPHCGHRHKPKGRVWQCKHCGFLGHRDVVGAANMHPRAFGQEVTFPRVVTYLRPGPLGRSSRADTHRRESASSSAPLLLGTEAIHTLSVMQQANSPPPARRVRVSGSFGLSKTEKPPNLFVGSVMTAGSSPPATSPGAGHARHHARASRWPSPAQNRGRSAPRFRCRRA